MSCQWLGCVHITPLKGTQSWAHDTSGRKESEQIVKVLPGSLRVRCNLDEPSHAEEQWSNQLFITASVFS